MKVLYVTTVSSTINAFLLPHIKMLIDLGYQVDIACSISKPINEELLNYNCRIFEVGFNRSPLSKENLVAYNQLKKIISNERYNIIHTHTPVASACVRMACRKLKNVKVFYTAHGFHFFKGAPFKNWLIYYPIERWLARYTDVLITINKEDYKRAKRSFKVCRVEYIPGVGLDTKKFSNITVDKLTKRKEIGIPRDAFVVLSVGELNKNKNHEVVFKAIAKLQNKQIYYVICGQGSLGDYLMGVSKKLGIEKQIKLLGFCKNMDQIYKMADVFVFPSFREGLSVALMEAMASGLPVVCSNIRGNNNLIVDGKGGYLVSPNDIEGFAKYIDDFLRSTEMRLMMGRYNMEAIKFFDLEGIIDQTKEVYLRK